MVFLTHNYPRWPGDVAGTFLHPLALALAERGHDVRVVAPSDAGQGGRDRLDGIPVRRVRYARPGRERFAYSGTMARLAAPANWLTLARLCRALRQGARLEAERAPAVVVHAHWWFPAGLAAPPELPTVVTMHGTDARLAAGLPGVGLLARRALRRGRVATAVSRSVAALARRAVSRPIDADHISPMPVLGTPRESRGGRGLLLVGRLTAQKRAHLALLALARLPEGARPRLTLVGDGPARPELERMVGQLGLSAQVSFAGAVPSNQVAELLDGADAFVLPARQEGLGLAAVEALLAGVPLVVCRDGGGLVELLDVDGAGVAVDPTPDAIAAALERVLAGPGARTAAAAAGREWAHRLSPARIAERCEAWYAEVRREA